MPLPAAEVLNAATAIIVANMRRTRDGIAVNRESELLDKARKLLNDAFDYYLPAKK